MTVSANSPAATRGARSARRGEHDFRADAGRDRPSSGRAVRSPWPPTTEPGPTSVRADRARRKRRIWIARSHLASDRPQAARRRCRASARPHEQALGAERAYQPEQGRAAGHDQASGAAPAARSPEPWRDRTAARRSRRRCRRGARTRAPRVRGRRAPRPAPRPPLRDRCVSGRMAVIASGACAAS